MYEKMTYETIIRQLLSRVPNTVDKREGSVIYDALAPCGAELAQAYVELDSILTQAFADTADRDHLVRLAAVSGTTPKPATKAVVKGEFNMDVSLGSRFNLDGVSYAAVKRLSSGVFQLGCEEPGRQGNQVGLLTPIDYINGLAKAQVTEILTPGTDLEDTETFRSRYLFGIRKPATSGNEYHYENWALEISGVGKAKAVGLWNGPGTVKVLLVDQDGRPASASLCQEVAAHIETERPVGAAVTVAAPSPLAVDVSAVLTLSAGTKLENVKLAVSGKVQDYLFSLVFAKSMVSLAIIGSLILGVDGVLDYQNLKLNGAVNNLQIGSGQIPVPGTVEVTV